MKILLIIISVFNFSELMAFKISSNLSKTDRNKVLEVISFGSSTKFLSDPYPLGGYSGLELSVTFENISVDDISELGDSTGSDGKLQYPSFNFAKGIYKNIDIHAYLTPFGRNFGINSYGALVRWGVFESERLPVNISLITHTNFSNINNQMTSSTTGIDLMAGVSLQDSSFYLGFGKLDAEAIFMGGPSGVTDSGLEEGEKSGIFHSYFGYVKHFRPVFVAVELNKYETSTVSARIGSRF